MAKALDEPGLARGRSPFGEGWPLTGLLNALVRWTVRGLVLVSSLAIIGLGTGFFVFVGTLDRNESPLPGKSDGIVALTGGSQRIGDAVDLLVKGHGRRLLISGVNEKTSREEIAKFNPEAQRLFACCVDLDYRARNTIGNAIETRRWASLHGFRSLIVVTSNYHMPRTLVELAKVLPDVHIVPHAVVAEQINPGHWWYDLTMARLLLSEYAKYVVAVFRTRIEGDPERSRMAVIVGGRKPVGYTPAILTR